jgi:hypothetical protein
MCEYALYGRASDAVSDGHTAPRCGSSRRGITYRVERGPRAAFRHKPPPGGGRRVVEGFAIRIRTETPGSVDERETDGNPVPSEVDYALRCSEPYHQGSAPAPRPCLTARRTGALAPARRVERTVNACLFQQRDYAK